MKKNTKGQRDKGTKNSLASYVPKTIFDPLNLCPFALSSVLLLLALSVPAQKPRNPTRPTSERQLKEAARRAPDSFAAQHALGEFYIQQQNLTTAIPYLARAHQLDPKHYANGYDLALAYLLTNDLTSARGQIARMLTAHNTAELHHLLGEVEEQAGDTTAAAAAYHRAAQLEPNEKNLLSLGNVLTKSTNYAEAIKFFRYGLQKFPRSAPLTIGLGIAEYSQGSYDQAVRTLCAAVEIDPTDHRPFLFLGEMYGVSPALADEVTRRMAQFVALHPRSALAHYYYAVNLRQGKREARAAGEAEQIEALLKRAIALDSQLAQAHFELGSLYADQQQYPAAIAALSRAVTLNPGMEKAHYRLGQLYQRTGQARLAAQAMETFQRLKAQRDAAEAKQ
jgi:tetratricopeptide (TPR) repeat protein